MSPVSLDQGDIDIVASPELQVSGGCRAAESSTKDHDSWGDRGAWADERPASLKSGSDTTCRGEFQKIATMEFSAHGILPAAPGTLAFPESCAAKWVARVASSELV